MAIRHATLADVAARSGVSIATASRVLAGSVSPSRPPANGCWRRLVS